jgi:hypothetical protein
VKEIIAEKAGIYEQRYATRIGRLLGSGNHGTVFVVERNANRGRFAVKFFPEEAPYFRELRSYEILREQKVRDIEGFSVPQFLGSDDGLLAIAITIVEPPFLLDFAGAYEEESVPDFPENVWAEWRVQKQEEFENRWPIVETILMVLRTHDIFMLDIHPRNLVFREGAG